MPRLLFVRHGRTTWNAEGRVQGGGVLDEVGLAQAAALGVRLRDEPLTAAYASPFPRTRQTANIVVGHHGLRVGLLPLLRDLDYGRFAGALLSEVRQDAPGLWDRWRDAPHTIHFAGGESLADLRVRIERAIAIVVERHPVGSILCVTHDSPARIVVSLALGLDDSHHNDADLVTPLASLTVVEVGPQGMRLEVRQDAAHLEGIDARA